MSGSTQPRPRHLIMQCERCGRRIRWKVKPLRVSCCGQPMQAEGVAVERETERAREQLRKIAGPRG